ncbi:MAG: right-handed parallel beta-helix repeat-containing protein, partial [Anaerolineales bacterium]
MTAAWGATGALIGGPDPSQRNIISGNAQDGVSLRVPGTSDHQVIGNYIGVDASGETSLGNGGTGVAIEYGATDNAISQNVISGNGGRGVRVRFLDASGNTISDNSIGVTASGAPLGNALGGIRLESGPNVVSGNVIAHNGAAALNNGGDGVTVQDGVGNHITQNSIYANTDRGINLSGSESAWYVTPNDPGDGDSGPNDFLNFPEFTSVTTALVEGTACDGCTVEVFRADPDPSSHGEGDVFLASGAAAGGVFSIDISAAGLGTCDPVTATATDAAGNTSEFSANLSPGAGGFACLSLVLDGPFLIGVILLGGALVGGLGFWFGKTLPFAAGGFVIGGLAGAAAFLPLREPVRRLLNPPPAIMEAASEPVLPTETPIAAIILPTGTAPAPVPETATLTATPTATRVVPGPLTPTRTATPAPDTTGPSIKAVSDAPDPIYVTQPKGCSPNASTVSASITDPSG